MYAVIETGGKQYRVEVGTELEVELLDVEAGASMKFDRVLLVADGETAAIGRPVVANAEVEATVIGRDRGPKTIAFKYRPKARSRVKKGHRQELTLLRISDIVLDGHSAAADVKAAEEATKKDRAKLEEAARRQAAADAELAAKLAAEKPVKAPAKASAAKSAAAKQATAEKPAKASTAKAAAAQTSKTVSASKAKADTAAAEKPAAKKTTTAKAPAKRTTKKES
ncbi:MAG: 50S ribosomal protein L21 [Chloroflexi bacterium]|nr:50S ribosomal protein L21 [Chloroflexota bacterium]